jgi:hypothetical protein
MKKTMYEILRVAPDAGPEAIETTYRNRVAQLEASAQPGDEDVANELKLLRQARQILIDPGQRSAYDASLKAGPRATTAPAADPFAANPVDWKRWMLFGTVALVSVVAASLVFSFVSWKPPRKPAPEEIKPRGRPVQPSATEQAAPLTEAHSPTSQPQPVADKEPSPPSTTQAKMSVAPSGPVAMSTESLFEKLAPSVAVVLSYDSGNRRLLQGSGVVVQSQRVLTNCHVLMGSEIVEVRQGKRSYRARLEYGDQDLTRDLCQLFVPDLEAAPVALGQSKDIKVGKRVFALGAPFGLELTLSEGIVSGLRTHQDSAYIQITTPISAGSSGGGLFDDGGALVGLTTFGVVAGQNLNFAVPAEWIRQLPTRPRLNYLPRQAASGEPPMAERPTAAIAPAAILGKWACTVSNFTGTPVTYEFRDGRFLLERRHRGEFISGRFEIRGYELILSSVDTNPRDVTVSIVEQSSKRLVLDHPLEESGGRHVCSR